MTVLIKDIPKADRPIERLVTHGVENLTNEELLTILIKTGTKDTSAKTLANEILKNVSNITELKNLNLKKLKKSV